MATLEQSADQTASHVAAADEDQSGVVKWGAAHALLQGCAASKSVVMSGRTRAKQGGTNAHHCAAFGNGKFKVLAHAHR
ncbi:MAG: hypothetical protein BWZ07_02442 [Alphaproteobacteria bacterium ADurb.BinA280]|nr:MAG: hypothetical protein BWZ07_02442 [Alphaproteobacteria bacterium ADurb.BinA280]